MNQNRLKQLMKFYEEEPNDPFNIYALATEYKTSDLDKALEFYELLINNHPEYIATYYHLAHSYIDIGEDEKAKLTFEAGIEIATRNNEAFALRELKSAFDEFMMDY